MVAKAIFLLVLTHFFIYVASQVTCPSNGIVCVPANCGTQYQQCSGSTFYAAQNTAPGTICYNGQMVYPTDPRCVASVTSTTGKVATTAAATTATTAKAATTSTTAAATTAKAATTATTAAATTAKAATTATTASASTTGQAATTARATTGSSSTTGSSGSCKLSDIFLQKDFDTLFPNANYGYKNSYAGQYAIFSYSNLIQAAQSFPTFGCIGTDTQKKLELAAFLGQTSQETSGWWSSQLYIWGYVYSTEVTTSTYCDSSNTVYPCYPGKTYNGRGPMQLSWNYNYGQFSQAVLKNSTVLLANPDLLLTDGVVAFQAALWFWMTPQAPKPSCHDVMTGAYVPSAADQAAGRVAGYGLTTDIINGGIECNQPTPQAVTNRVGYYTTYAKYLLNNNTVVLDNLYCNNMKSY